MERNSNFSTLALLIIKDLRLNKKIHQGWIAQSIGKSPSSWAKLENGQTQLTFDMLYGACFALQVRPTDIIYLVEKLTYFFNTKNFFFQYGSCETDDLLPLILEYYNLGYTNLINNQLTSGYSDISILLQPFPSYTTPSVIRYCTESEYKIWADNGAQGIPPHNYNNW